MSDSPAIKFTKIKLIPIEFLVLVCAIVSVSTMHCVVKSGNRFNGVLSILLVLCIVVLAALHSSTVSVMHGFVLLEDSIHTISVVFIFVYRFLSVRWKLEKKDKKHYEIVN